MKRMPSQKTGRLAPFIEAIEDSKQAGFTWEELRIVFEDNGFEIADKAMQFRETFFRAKHRYEKGTLRADQKPLPDEYASEASKTESDQEQNQNQSEAMGDRKGDPGQDDSQFENQPEAETGNSNRRPSMPEEAEQAGIKFDDD